MTHPARYVAVLSIGSNMPGDLPSPTAQLGRARQLISTAHTRIVDSSRHFATPPWGGVEQQDFVNQSLTVETELPPLDLLRHCQSAERAAQRHREVRWGPRTLDVDVVWIGEFLSDAQRGVQPVTSADQGWGDTLILPHPRAHLRAFVLVPWLDLAIARQPWCTVGGSTIAELLSTLDPQEVAEVQAIEAVETECNPQK